MRDSRIRILSEIGLAVALAITLNAIFTFLVPIRLPQGGSVSLIMLPIIVIALMRGSAVGITTGVLVGFTDLMFGPYVISIPQMLLDYPIAYGAVGLAGIFAINPQRVGSNPTMQKIITFAILGTVVGGLGRLLAHVLSGVIFFAHYAPELENVWVYSLLYNITFMAPSTIIVGICAAIAFPVLRAMLVQTQQA